MKKFKTIHFNFLRADAHYEILMQFKNMLDACPSVKAIVAALFPGFVALLEKEGVLLNEMHKSDYTAKIAAADRRVDRCLTGMNAAIASARHHFNHEVVEAAQSLYNRIKAFGEIGAKSYEEETAAVNLLLADLAMPEYVEKAALVGLTPWVTELTAAETDFEQLLSLRYTEAAQKPQGRLANARRDTEAAYRPITDRLVAATIINDDPQLLNLLNEFIAEFNTVITYFNEHTHRHARKDLGEGDHTVIEPIETQAYTEHPVTPIPKVHYREDGNVEPQLIASLLTLGTDFSVTYKNNTNVGMAEVTIHGKGKYKGTKTTTFNIARGV
jgi:hypothetical protein